MVVDPLFEEDAGTQTPNTRPLCSRVRWLGVHDPRSKYSGTAMVGVVSPRAASVRGSHAVAKSSTASSTGNDFV
jgi:hypothetical protein